MGSAQTACEPQRSASSDRRAARLDPGTSCALCRELGTVDVDFVDSLGARKAHAPAAHEAIVDCLGFCFRHGVSLAQARHETRVLGVLGDAAGAIIRLLADERRNAELLERLASVADRSCPGCHYVEHHTTRAVRANAERRSPAPLCFPHYRDTVYGVQSGVLPGLARAELEHLRDVAAMAADLTVRTRPTGEVPLPSPDDGVRRALEAVACATDAMRPADTRSDSSPDHEPSCAVCRAVDHAQTHWLEAVAMASRLAQDVWIVFPMCSTHIQRCAALGDDHLTSSVVAYAAAAQVDVLSAGVQWLAQDEQARESAKQSVWYRRQGPAYILGQQRRMITRLPRCPGCERLIVARDGAVTDLLRALHRGAGMDRVRALCLKHFAGVYLMLPPGDLRAAATRVHVERLGELHDQIVEHLKMPGDPPPDTAGAAQLSWPAVIEYFSSRG